MNNDDKAVMKIMDNMMGGLTAIMPTEDASIELECAIEDICIRYDINAIVMRRPNHQENEHRISLKQIL
jgi:hypothetical protein